MESIRLIAVALAIILLIAYASFPTKNHYWDGIGFALNIEGAGQNADGLVLNDHTADGVGRIYFNPNHLFHNLIGYLIYTPTHVVLPSVRALDVLRAISIFSSVATSLLVFLILARSSRDLRFSAWMTLLMAFSATWWKFSTDADAYIPSVFLLVFCGFLLTNPGRRPPVVMIGLLHALGILVHQISVLFFPAVVVAIWSHSCWSDSRKRRRSALTYALTASVPVISAYLGVWLGVLDRPWSLQEFMKWTTSNGSEEFAFHSAASNAIETIRSSARVFFGGRISHALAFVEKPLLVVLVCLMLAALAYLVVGLAQAWRAPRRVVSEPVLIESMENGSWRFLVTWVVGFAAFLFIWLTEYPYYRLYYLPPVILLMGLALKRTHRPIERHRMSSLTAFVCFMAVFNFTFLIYPYSKIEATPPINLAVGAKGIWHENVLVLYKDFTCDNWMMRYFNPHTTWRKVDFTDRDDLARKLRAALQNGNTVWLDTTMLGHLTSSGEAREALEAFGRLSSPWGISNLKHHIQFAELLVDESFAGKPNR